KDYPAQVHCLYAQGFSITEFLVSRSDRATFLRFIAQGMNFGWDNAVQTFYRHRNVEEMEEAWLAYLRDGRRIPDAQLARNTRGGVPESGMLVRLTAPPVPPLDPLPVARGLMPTQDQVGQRFGQASAVPGYLPPTQNVPGTWQPLQPAGQG